MKHTPGSWTADAGKVTRFIPEQDGGPMVETIAICSGDCEGSPIANARLIAAAPDLLAACEDANELEDIYLSEIQRLCGPDAELASDVQGKLHHIRQRRYAAIAKAKGEGQ